MPGSVRCAAATTDVALYKAVTSPAHTRALDEALSRLIEAADHSKVSLARHRRAAAAHRTDLPCTQAGKRQRLRR